MKTFPLFIAVTVLAHGAFGQSELDDIRAPSLTFKPDYTLEGSNLDGWEKIGAGDWRAKEGELTEMPGSDGVGSLLMSKPSFQDVAVNVQFKCAPGAEAGIVFRLQKIDEGWKGVLISIKDGEIADYAVTFDADGKESKREPLQVAGGNNLMRVAPTPPADARPARSGGQGERGRGRRGGDSNSPLKRPDTSYRLEPDRDFSRCKCSALFFERRQSNRSRRGG
jgi:hypothetical protein